MFKPKCFGNHQIRGICTESYNLFVTYLKIELTRSIEINYIPNSKFCIIYKSYLSSSNIFNSAINIHPNHPHCSQFVYHPWTSYLVAISNEFDELHQVTNANNIHFGRSNHSFFICFILALKYKQNTKYTTHQQQPLTTSSNHLPIHLLNDRNYRRLKEESYTAPKHKMYASTTYLPAPYIISYPINADPTT